MKAGSRRRSGRFLKRDSRRKKPKPVPLLLDMRAVYEQDESQDRGPAQKALRKMFNENTDQYIARLGRLEQAFQAEVFREEGSVIPVVTEVDEGTEKSLRLLDDLLARYHAEQAAEDAEFAKRPDAAAIGVTLQKKLAASLEREALLRKQIHEMRGQSLDDKGDDVTVALREAMNEGFSCFLRQLTDPKMIDGLHVFLKIKWTFQVAFLKGVIWTKRQSRKQAKLAGK